MNDVLRPNSIKNIHIAGEGAETSCQDFSQLEEHCHFERTQIIIDTAVTNCRKSVALTLCWCPWRTIRA